MAKANLKFDTKKLMEMRRQHDRLKRAALEGGGKGLTEHAEVVMDKSQDQVPVGSGALKSAKYIEKPKFNRNDNTVSVKLGYGGPADRPHPTNDQMVSDYMVWVHEDLNAFHPIGKAKYLEDPVMEELPELHPRIAVGVKDQFARVATKR